VSLLLPALSAMRYCISILRCQHFFLSFYMPGAAGCHLYRPYYTLPLFISLPAFYRLHLLPLFSSSISCSQHAPATTSRALRRAGLPLPLYRCARFFCWHPGGTCVFFTALLADNSLLPRIYVSIYSIPEVMKRPVSGQRIFMRHICLVVLRAACRTCTPLLGYDMSGKNSGIWTGDKGRYHQGVNILTGSGGGRDDTRWRTNVKTGDGGVSAAERGVKTASRYPKTAYSDCGCLSRESVAAPVAVCVKLSGAHRLWRSVPRLLLVKLFLFISSAAAWRARGCAQALRWRLHGRLAACV